MKQLVAVFFVLLGIVGGLTIEVWGVATVVYTIIQYCNGTPVTFWGILWLVVLWSLRTFVAVIFAIICFCLSKILLD